MKTKLPFLRHMRRGGAMVEAALSISFLIMIVCAILQYAMFMNAEVTVQYYARECARYAAVHATDSDMLTDTLGAATLQSYIATNLAKGGTIQAAHVTTTYFGQPTDTVVNGVTVPTTSVSVEVSYNMQYSNLFYGYVPGVPSSRIYNYYYTTNSEKQN